MVYESLDSMSSFTALIRNIHIAVTKTKEILDMPPMDIDGAEIEPPRRDIELRTNDFIKRIHMPHSFCLRSCLRSS